MLLWSTLRPKVKYFHKCTLRYYLIAGIEQLHYLKFEKKWFTCKVNRLIYNSVIDTGAVEYFSNNIQSTYPILISGQIPRQFFFIIHINSIVY